MKFIADLHVHSKYSIATAKNLDLENLHVASRLKGITVVGTGDFTHPKWLSEIREKLVPAGDGLFRLRKEIESECDSRIPEKCKGPVRFILQCEISNVYKKDGRTRKNHNVIFAPDLDAAQNFGAKLGAIGNIESDGRPILGLDTRNLLEVLLEVSDRAFLIPAHIWTPWFSLLGSKSGFNSVAECFGDLAGEIFAAETGLSSDPPMNWRVSDLNRLTLVSNSDAHSPFTLGRNANVFDTDLSYSGIRSALETGDPEKCLGTLDLYPEEGKYHMDGHRNCGVVLKPKESMRHGGKCPVCGKPLTLGVLYRVEELADRPEGVAPENALPCFHIIPLPEILSEILGVGPKSKKVGQCHQKAIEQLGPELDILTTVDPETAETAGIPFLAEALRRMRSGNVRISPGHDGVYGTVRLFDPDEMNKLAGQQTLFDMPAPPAKKKTKRSRTKAAPSSKKEKTTKPQKTNKTIAGKGILDGLNPEQTEAVLHEEGALIIVAGPGAGKTRTLTHRIAHLMKEKSCPAEHILAVTFTNKAAGEMRERLEALLPGMDLPLVATFHAICFKMIEEMGGGNLFVIDDTEQKLYLSEAVRRAEKQGAARLKPNRLAGLIATAKQRILGPSDPLDSVAETGEHDSFAKTYAAYQSLLERESRCDFEDLIMKVVKALETNPETVKKYRDRFRHVFVDEYQDLNEAQYRLARALSPDGNGLTVIGDPDQSIYGFRGSDSRFFTKFQTDWPACKTIRLARNYRSTETILAASGQVIAKNRDTHEDGPRIYSNIQGKKTLTILEPESEKAEAVAVGKTIEKMVGGIGFHSVDFGKTDETGAAADRAFSDFAVMYRTAAQGEIIADIFEQAGIPYQLANREHAYCRKEIAELAALLKIVENAGTVNDLGKIAGLWDADTGKKAFDRFKSWYFKTDGTVADALDIVKTASIPGLDLNMQRALKKLAQRIDDFGHQTNSATIKEKLAWLAENTSLSSRINASRKTAAAYDSLLALAESYGNRTSEFLTALALQTDPDTYDATAQKVALMTMHASKGLEFPVVFVTGCEQDYIPFKRSQDASVDVDEERRLFYVAMTRAMEELFLTRVQKRRIYGKTLQRQISPFISDIETSLLETQRRAKKTPKKKDDRIQFGLFDSE